MNDITFRSAKLLATMLLGSVATANVYAIQPWADGVKPLLVRMAEIDQALSLNMAESMSESLTAKDAIRLETDKDSLPLEKAGLTRSIKMSTEVRDNTLVFYAFRTDARFNSTLHAGAQARK